MTPQRKTNNVQVFVLCVKTGFIILLEPEPSSLCFFIFKMYPYTKIVGTACGLLLHPAGKLDNSDIYNGFTSF